MDASSLGPKGFVAFRKKYSPEEQDQKLKDVAEMYEKQFLKEMVKAMRGTVQESGLIKVNQAEKIYREELDTENVGRWSKQGGLGLGQMIYQQLIDKYGVGLGIKGAIQKPKGPMALDEKSILHGRVLADSSATKKTTFQFSDLESPELYSLKSPWEGRLLGSKRLGAEENVLEILHDNGLKSQLVFRGQPLPGLQGRPLQAGETIGLLSPEARTLFWNVEPGPEATLE